MSFSHLIVGSFYVRNSAAAKVVISGRIDSKIVAEKRQDIQSSYNVHSLDG